MLSICLCAHAKAQIAPEDFAILPWGWTPGDKAVLEDIKACGFNLAGFVAPSGVEAVASAGLKCIVSDPRGHVVDAEAGLEEAEIKQRVAAITEKYADHPAVFGYYVRDEPNTSLFDVLAKWSAAYRTAAPKQRTYINLYPSLVTGEGLKAKNYEDYVDTFVAKVKPTFLSYDHYALMEDGSLKDGYFQNLELMRAAGLKHELPFWNIVLGNAHFRYAEPTENGLRFQVYTTLAYGARGISYFMYFTPGIGNYRLGPIDQFGHKTPTWEMLRRINLQIHKLAPTYIQLKSVNVFHFPDGPEGCHKLNSSIFLSNVAGGNFVVGEFEGPNQQPFVMVVNKELHRSTQFEVKFKEAGAIQFVNAYSGGIEPFAGENNWLAPGQGMLLTLKK